MFASNVAESICKYVLSFECSIFADFKLIFLIFTEILQDLCSAASMS